MARITIIETAKATIINKFAQGKTERQVRIGLIQSNASSPVIDVALDLVRNDGKLSPAGRRKAKAAGVLRPWELWPRYTPNAGLNPTQGRGGAAG